MEAEKRDPGNEVERKHGKCVVRCNLLLAQSAGKIARRVQGAIGYDFSSSRLKKLARDFEANHYA